MARCRSVDIVSHDAVARPSTVIGADTKTSGLVLGMHWTERTTGEMIGYVVLSLECSNVRIWSLRHVWRLAHEVFLEVFLFLQSLWSKVGEDMVQISGRSSSRTTTIDLEASRCWWIRGRVVPTQFLAQRRGKTIAGVTAGLASSVRDCLSVPKCQLL